MAPCALDLTKITGSANGQVALTGRPSFGDHAHQGLLGLRQPPTLTVGNGQIPVDQQAHRPVVLGEVTQRLLAVRSDPVGIALPPRDRRANQRNRRGLVGDRACQPGQRTARMASTGSSPLAARARSAAASSDSAASTRPSIIATTVCASNSRGREPTSSAGSAATHRSRVPRSLRNSSASTSRSISRAAQPASPAARAWRIASSASQ